VRRAFPVAAGLLLAFAGCDGPPAAPPFQASIRVQSDPGVPVAGALILRGEKQIATTGPDGRAMISIRGKDGDVAEVSIRCPENLQQPTSRTGIKLARIADQRAAEYDVACPPMTRRVVVAIRAENGPYLPVVYLNRAVARTDAAGAAHFALDVAPDSSFEVRLDTTQAEKLKPQNPTKPFVVGRHDDILVFEQHFELERPKVVRRAAPIIPKPLAPR
jgi:hypothetical protein